MEVADQTAPQKRQNHRLGVAATKVELTPMSDVDRGEAPESLPQQRRGKVPRATEELEAGSISPKLKAMGRPQSIFTHEGGSDNSSRWRATRKRS